MIVIKTVTVRDVFVRCHPEGRALSVSVCCVWPMLLIDESFIDGGPQCRMLPLEILTAVKAASGQSH